MSYADGRWEPTLMMGSLHSQRGFSMIEVLVALGIGAIIALAAGNALLRALQARELAAARLNDRSELAQLIAAIRADNQSATAFVIPSTDSAGEANGDGHAFDLHDVDALSGERIIEYRWIGADATHTTRVERSSLDPAALASPAPLAEYDGVTALQARSLPLSALASAGSDGDPLFAGATLRDVAIDLGDGAAAGNALLALTLRTAHAVRALRLANLAAPTRFTYVLQYTPTP